MNILIPHNWLLEHLETDAKPDQLAEFLSLCGPSVEHLTQVENDTVYDIEVTTNRVDAMSVRGIAREAAVILSQFDLPSHLKQVSYAAITPSGEKTLPLPKITDYQNLSKRIMAVVLADLEKTPTPDWMATRLKQIGQNVHHSIIDITNYITHELGHPCHAFDYDRIMQLGGEIIVTEATAGERFETLDGEQFETVGGEIVFKNPAGEIIDLPAIKGTSNSAINDDTKNVLLWMESLDPQKIRFASMTHAIRTIAAQLNEKNVDPHLGEEVMKYGVELYHQLCNATIASELYDHFPARSQQETVEVPLNTFERYLGVSLSTDKITSILNVLGCEVTASNDTLTVTPPTFRPDLTIPADFVEEVARIYGYHNLPNALMDTAIPTNYPQDVNFDFEINLKHFIANSGWQEVYTYSMVSETLALESGFNLEDHLQISNPLTEDRVYLRRSLAASLREVTTDNPQRSELSLFELANVYHPQENDLPQEVMTLGLLSTQSYGVVKGMVEAIAATHFIQGLHFEVMDEAPAHYSQAARIEVVSPQKNLQLGTLGILKSGEAVAELKVAELLVASQTHPTYQPILKTTPVIESLTFTFPQKTYIGKVITKITQHPLVSKIELESTYEQNVTFKLYFQIESRNLDSTEIDEARSTIVADVESTYKANLVGSLA